MPAVCAVPCVVGESEQLSGAMRRACVPARSRCRVFLRCVVSALRILARDRTGTSFAVLRYLGTDSTDVGGREEFTRHGMDDIVTLAHRNVCKDGFTVEDTVDAGMCTPCVSAVNF